MIVQSRVVMLNLENENTTMTSRPGTGKRVIAGLDL